MSVYYNEIDPKAAAWLRELIKQGHIADGVVDERSIRDVRPSELGDFIQCHFFAGIGVWSYALRQAGWPDDRPVWTGSCPCQPFSTAGKRKGFDDERHLWPDFHWLIKQCRPVAVFGEQVAGKDGETWIDLVQSDLEREGYQSGVCITAACGFGAPHQRRRLYWCAVADNKRNGRGAGTDKGRAGRELRAGGQEGSAVREVTGDSSAVHQLADPAGHGQQRQGSPGPVEERHATGSIQAGQLATGPEGRGADGQLADTGHGGGQLDGLGHPVGCAEGAPKAHQGSSGQGGSETGQRQIAQPADDGAGDGMADTDLIGTQRHQPQNRQGGRAKQNVQDDSVADTGGTGLQGWECDPTLPEGRRHSQGRIPRPDGATSPERSPTNGFWRDADWLFCRDGKWRPVEPGACPLVDGTSARVGRLRGYGNALVAPQAQAFIEVYLEIDKTTDLS